ncbi:MAG: GIY-YIG nuclease family protein [Patescibacteria group bacterium]|nr:GIY-YIG nuclease family protein [Patescibacteria group bacterium]
MYYVYLLRDTTSGRWYIGFTSDLRRRIQEHKRHKNISTADYGNIRLIYYEAYLNKLDAIGREKFLKSGSGYRFLKKQLSNYLGLKPLTKTADIVG